MKDKLSALMDGDLDEHSMRPVLDALRRDASLRTDWATYSLIGDALRGEVAGSPDFAARVMASIEAEPTVLAPRPVAPAPAAAAWRKLMPLAASVMGVAAVGWVAHTLYSGNEPLPAVAAVERLPLAEAPVRPVSVTLPAEDAHREYVFVHQAMTGGGPIPGGVQYVRTVSAAGQEAGR